jgi:hypothetical protein
VLCQGVHPVRFLKGPLHYPSPWSYFRGPLLLKG